MSQKKQFTKSVTAVLLRISASLECLGGFLDPKITLKISVWALTQLSEGIVWPHSLGVCVNLNLTTFRQDFVPSVIHSTLFYTYLSALCLDPEGICMCNP